MGQAPRGFPPASVGVHLPRSERQFMHVPLQAESQQRPPGAQKPLAHWLLVSQGTPGERVVGRRAAQRIAASVS